MTDRRNASGRLLSTEELEERNRAREAAGWDAWNKSTRDGRNFVARTTQELRALGAQVLPPVSAFTNGFVDAATAGLGDPYVAFKYASMGAGEGRSFRERYGAIRRGQKAQDDYDREHHPKARLAGGAVGTVGSIAATGVIGAGEQAAVRLTPYAARLAPTVAGRVAASVLPHVAVGVGGAAASTAGQVVADAASRRLSSPQTYGEAAAGGAVGGLVTSYVGPRAGAVADAATAEGLHGLNTGDFSLERLQNNAVMGAHAARVGDFMGRDAADSLHFSKKGKLGELMSNIKTRASGQSVTGGKTRTYLSKGYTVIDSETSAGTTVESKFGPSARLSHNQKRAQVEIPQYQVDSWLPADVGRAAGGLSGLLFAHGKNSGGDEY
jgi:hypothetical protein